MPYTLKQFIKDVLLDHLDELDPEDRLRGLGRRELEAHLRKLSRKHNQNDWVLRLSRGAGRRTEVKCDAAKSRFTR